MIDWVFVGCWSAVVMLAAFTITMNFYKYKRLVSILQDSADAAWDDAQASEQALYDVLRSFSPYREYDLPLEIVRRKEAARAKLKECNQ